MKNNKFLKIYAIVIMILLIVIFMIPDDFYLNLHTKLNKQDPKEIKELEEIEYTFTDIDIQKEKLLTKDHNYEYLMLDSIGTETKTVECTGSVANNEDSGTCKSTQEVSYTKETKKETILNMNIKYVDLEYIFKSIKDIEPTVISYTKSRELLYKTKILELDTDIIIYTDLDNITQINISNAYMTYVFKYTSIKD